ncbi:MAG: DUF3137 domain-containing protein [Alphaproteobacteria bacterium]|nr:DUF3137 domain-containing protein [Alphaproteobacteria bacterium]
MTQSLDLSKLDDSAFEALYAEKIKPCLDAHEPERQAATASFWRRIMIGAPLAAAAGLLAAAIFQTTDAGLFVAGAGVVVAGIFAWSKVAAVKAEVKAASCSAVAESIGVTFTLKDFQPVAFPRFRSLDLLPGHDRSKFEDWFTGAYQGASFDLYEAHLERRSRDSKGRTSWTTVFRGQVVRMQFPRRFLGVTVVRRDMGFFNVFGGGKGLDRVGLEDSRFEKAFEVWGTDQVEARYLLHPILMERLLALEAAFAGKKLRCAFEQGEMLIAVEGGNLFEAGDMFKPLANSAWARKLVDEIAMIHCVMDAVLTAQTRR